MLRFVTVIALAGCGRVGFDAAADGSVMDGVTPDVVPLGHDEDGDGIRDVDDNCPHVPNTAQTDQEGDRVGDICDPNPTTANDRITLFATMSPGDQPFQFQSGDSTWTQLPDALRMDGQFGPGGDLYGGLYRAASFGDVQVTFGIDVLAIVPGSTSRQNQIALQVSGLAPYYQVELNQVEADFSKAQVTHFDGAVYGAAAFEDLATGMHTGSLVLQTIQRVGSGVRLDVGWPGEPYTAEVMDAVYQGANVFRLDVNNVHLEIRYVCVIEST